MKITHPFRSTHQALDKGTSRFTGRTPLRTCLTSPSRSVHPMIPYEDTFERSIVPIGLAALSAGTTAILLRETRTRRASSHNSGKETLPRTMRRNGMVILILYETFFQSVLAHGGDRGGMLVFALPLRSKMPLETIGSLFFREHLWASHRSAEMTCRDLLRHAQKTVPGCGLGLWAVRIHDPKRGSPQCGSRFVIQGMQGCIHCEKRSEVLYVRERSVSAAFGIFVPVFSRKCTPVRGGPSPRRTAVFRGERGGGSHGRRGE